MLSFTNKNIHWIIYVLFLYGKIVSGESLALNSVLKDLCSRTLSIYIFQICTGGIEITDLPSTRLSKTRSKRGALFYAKERQRRQVVDECCLRPCTVAQLIEYCPDNWWQINEQFCDFNFGETKDTGEEINFSKDLSYDLICLKLF